MTVTRAEFDARIGRLDRCLSEFLDLFSGSIDEPDRQTLKHHADDLIGVGNAMLGKVKPEVKQPYDSPRAKLPGHASHCSIYLPMDRTCDCGAGRNHDRI